MRTVAVKRFYPAAMPWALGAAIMVLGYSSDILLARSSHSEWMELADDLVLGMLVALIGAWWLKRRNRATVDKLQRIANINHLIRNELEVILYSANAGGSTDNIKHIQKSVGQISWILRELLGPDLAIDAGSASAADAQAAGPPGGDACAGD